MDNYTLSSAFAHPFVQHGLAPFAVASFTVMVLHRLRLGGLALIAAYGIAVWLSDGWALQPLTPLRKIALIALATPALGLLVDFMARESLPWRIGLAVLAAASVLWVYEPLLTQMPGEEAARYGGGAALLLAWLTATMLAMNGAPARSSGAAVALAGGTALCAWYGGAHAYGHHASALAAGAAAFLLWIMLTNRKWSAGATLRLPAAVLTGLLLCGAILSGAAPWYAAAVLALVPLAARIPAPERWALRSQAALVCLYTFVVAAAAVYTLWRPWREWML